MMIKSEAQQTTSPLFLDEEENNLEDVGNTLINTALPFDRCVKIDKEFEEELEDREAQMDKREFLHELPKIKTTISKSKKDVLSWVGTKNILLWVCEKFLTPAVGTVISAASLCAIVICLVVSGLSDDLISAGVAGAFFTFLAVVAFFWTAGEEVNNIGYIHRKLDTEDYLISNYVVDCPKSIKIELYECLKLKKELYARYVPQKQELQLFTNNGEVSYYMEVDSYESVKNLDKDDFEYQLSYFANQLIPNKFYRISDIIIDKAVEN